MLGEKKFHGHLNLENSGCIKLKRFLVVCFISWTFNMLICIMDLYEENKGFDLSRTNLLVESSVCSPLSMNMSKPKVSWVSFYNPPSIR